MTPIACGIVFITVVGIPLALAVCAVYLIFLYAAGILAGLAIGQWILGRGRETRPKPVGSMILGVLILALIGLIPYLGTFVGFVALVVGLGGLLISLWRGHQSPEAVS